VERLTALAKAVYIEPGKTFEAGIGQAMVAVLASPRFLFRVEESAPGASPAAAWSPVDEYSLAARLSYFLWSTLPDDELTRLAAHRELRKNLPAQVRRMLADPRSEALVRNFTGQWLQTRDLGGVAIDVRAILARDNGTEKQLHEQAAGFLARQNAAQPPPGARPPPFARDVNPPKSLDQPTRQAMKSEAEMFFASILHEDRSIDDLIDGHYTYLNEKLAAFYGLTNLGLTGDEMRRVDLPAGCVRGGVLTEGAVLVITSNPDRTSPVKRGVFVLNNILGTPPPPPPPNVPALEAAEQSGTNQEATLRVALEMHRNTPLCASCHARFDPIGLGLENFNAMGRWRDQERNQPIDPSGTLITGETFTDVRELKHILLTGHREDFYRCLTSKLLTYSLGRGLEYYDVGTVDQIVHHLEENQGRFSALLTGIIDSAPFQERRNHANAVYADSVETPAHNDAPQIATTKTAP
jgi:hypothetical protein